MFSKSLRVEIDAESWKRKKRPSWVASRSGTQAVDVGKALLLLGSITTPTGLSAGSPERYWACIRYFSACAESNDLRIAVPFTSLDPHQRGILSDDFGVAIATSWLIDTLGGVKDIVDGRQFVVNMGINNINNRPPKVGPGKCPDFVLEDDAGKFHVLECKGTQSGRSYLDGAMKNGRAQKRGIEVKKHLRGERLVIGLSLSDERNRHGSRLVVIDPDARPMMTINGSNRGKVGEVLARLRMARALNLIGFSRTAFEISWPKVLMENEGPEVALLTHAERKVLAISYGERERDWRREIDSELKTAESRLDGDFLVQRMQFDIPAIKLDSGRVARRVTVVRGINADVIHRLSNSAHDLRDAASEEANRISDLGGLELAESDNSCRLEYSNFFFSEIDFD